MNKVYALDEFEKLKPKLDNDSKEELERYKFKNIGKSNLFLESDSDAELEVLKSEIKKKKFESHYNNFDQSQTNSKIIILIQVS